MPDLVVSSATRAFNTTLSPSGKEVGQMVGNGNRGLRIGCTLGNHYRSSGDSLCALIVPKAK